MAENPLSAKGIANLLRKRLQEGDFDPRFDERALEQDRLRSLELDVLPAPNILPSPTIKLSDLEGKEAIITQSDRTASGDSVLGMNNVPFEIPVRRYGGQGFMFNPDEKVWASGYQPINKIMKEAIESKRRTGVNPLITPYQMAPTGGDFSTTTGELMIEYAKNNMNKTQKKALDSAIRKFSTVGSMKKGKRVGAGFKVEGWKGVDDPASIAVWRNTPDPIRKEIMNMMDVQFRDKGGLSIGEARLANADANQLTSKDAGIYNVGMIDVAAPYEGFMPGGGFYRPSMHPSYPVAIPGSGIGTLRNAGEATAFDLVPDLPLGGPQRPVVDPAAPTPQEIRSLSMKPRVAKITDKILKRMQDRGVNINSFAGLTGNALVYSLIGAGLLTSQEAAAAPGIGDMLDPTKNFGLTTKMRESVQRSKQKVQSGSQWEGFLKNKGVPKGEFEVFGLSDILKRESVTQDELIDAIDQNQLEMKKTILSDKPSVNIDFTVEPIDFDIVYPQRVIDEKVKAEIEYFKDEAKNTLTPQNTSDGVVVYDDAIKDQFWASYENPQEALGMSEEDFDLWLYNDEGDLSGDAELALNNWAEKGLREALGEGDATNFTRLTLQRDGMPTDYSLIKAAYGEELPFYNPDLASMDKDMQKRWQENYAQTFTSDNEAQVKLQDMYEGDNPSARSQSPKWERFTLDGGDNYRELLLQIDPEGPSMFDQSHSGLPNEVGHIRVKDRVGPNGERILYVEEVQSDWAQQGREEGFALSPQEETAMNAANVALQQELAPSFEYLRTLDTADPSGLGANLSQSMRPGEGYTQVVSGLAFESHNPSFELDPANPTYPFERGFDTYKRLAEERANFDVLREKEIMQKTSGQIVAEILKDPDLTKEITDYLLEADRDLRARLNMPLVSTGDELRQSPALIGNYVRNRLMIEQPNVLMSRGPIGIEPYKKIKGLSSFIEPRSIEQKLIDVTAEVDENINNQLLDVGVNPAEIYKIFNIVDRYQNDLGKNLGSLKSEIGKNPFVTKSKAWNDLLTKNILKEASEGDYDLVAYAPSSVHINRWNEEGLEQQYDVLLPSAFKKITGQTPSPSIRYDKRPQGGMPKDTSEWAEDTVITDDGWRFRSTTVPGRQRYVNSEFQEWIPDDPKNPEGSGSINYEVEGWISPVIDLRKTMKGQKDMSVKDFVKKKSLPLFSTAIATSAGISALSPELMASEVSMKADVASGEAALDIISGLIAPVAGGIAGLMQYKEQLPQRVYEVLNNNPEAVAALASNVKQAREDVASGLNYEPRSALARQASDEFKKGITALLEPVIETAAPIVDYALDPENIYDERGLNLLPAAVQGGKFIYDQILGEPEREAVISAMETI
jgi:hypothetical protein